MGGVQLEGGVRGEDGVQSLGGGVLVSEKQEVGWDLAWPSRMPPKAEVKGSLYGKQVPC